MTSNTTPSGTVSSSSVESSSGQAWMAFDGNNSTFWSSAYMSTSTPRSGWLKYSFSRPVLIVKYNILSTGAYAPLSWTFEGSNDNSTWTVLDTRNNQTGWTLTEEREYTFSNSNKYLHYRININNSAGANNYLRIYEAKMFELIYENKCIVFNNTFKYYNNNQWINLSTPPVETDYLTYGMDDISTVPESAWSQLEGEVELCYYTDDLSKTEVSFNIETEPFTLAEEWEDNEIKILEYTDDPNQTESTITIETEPFTVYDELGDSVDVLYYTDDPEKTTAELNITANYSPLDELEGDFDVVTWTDDEDVIKGVRELVLSYDALPFEQLIIQPSDITTYGDIKSIIATQVPQQSPNNGKLKLIASMDSGKTWLTYRFDKWRVIDHLDLSVIARNGLEIEEFNKIPLYEIKKVNRLGYYLDDSEHYENSYSLQDVKIIGEAPRNGVEVEDVAFYLLNTTATINLTFSGNKLKGVLDDVDKGKVRYRVSLNNNPYYPASGQFTPLQSSPFDINFIVDDRMINFGVDNTLKVEFEDYWGQTDSWIMTFKGTHSGLVFTDESGNFYTTAFGEVLKHLDFGQIIAGQTTLDQKVILKNNIGYDVKNISLKCIQPNLNGVEVELSERQTPFIALPELLYPDVLKPDEHIEFAVRISTVVSADETPSGTFEIRVNADRA